MYVTFNGQLIDYDQATICHDDAGFQHAVGLFETMTARHGRVFRLKAHLNRLAASAQQLGLVRQLDRSKLQAAIDQILEHNELSEARVRLTLTAGRINLLRADPNQANEPTVLAVATKPVQYDPAYFDAGISVLIAPPLANPFDPMFGHKTLSYWGRLRVLQQAASVAAGEAIILNISNHLASGAISNLFVVKEDRLLTPIARGEEVKGALAAPVLPGVTRAAVIEAAESQAITVEKKMLSVEDLLDADEVFLTNSSWHVLPVTRVEKSLIGDGQVGSLTRRLRTALLNMIEQETKP